MFLLCWRELVALVLLWKRELVVLVWLCSCWGRKNWLLRVGCVLAWEERAVLLGLILFLLGKRELVA